MKKDKKFEEYGRSEWLKVWAGRWSFFTNSYLGHQHSKIIREKIGAGPSIVIITIRKGVCVSYYKKSDYEGFGKRFGDMVIKDKSAAIFWSQKLKDEADNIRALIKKLDGKISSLKELEDFLNAMENYAAAHVFVKQAVNFIPQYLLDELLPLMEEARLYAEQIYIETEEFTRKMAEELSKKTSYRHDLVLCLTADELKGYFMNKRLPDRKLLAERDIKSTLIFKDGEYDIITWEDVEELEKQMTGSSEAIVRGRPAYPGKVSGTVRIILDPDKADNFNRGDILVSGMTRPEYLHLMEKAGAVVTDAGGILCHAAIVAREIKKPTVIGTEKATKVFKDGDIVEVDAGKGIVRKIR